MNVDTVIKKVQKEFSDLSQLPISSVTGVSKSDGEWVVSLEALERKAIPETMDLLGSYEIHLDGNANLLSYERKKLRRRGETDTGG